MGWVIESQVSEASNVNNFVYPALNDRNVNLQILQHFGEPEALRVIDLRCVDVVHIVDPSKADRRRKILVETRDRLRCSIEVLGVSGCTPRIEVGLEHFRTEEAVFVVEREI